ncbi:MAG: DUF6106 family protein [Candidatus Excrementavichristensenella sp.]|jgi:hypothetical protein
MMDNFREEVAVRQKPGLYNLMYILCWVIIVLSGIMAFMSLQGVLLAITTTGFDGTAWFNIVLTLLFGLALFLCLRNKDNLKTEFEYTFTNGDLDVSKVMNNRKRKYLTCLNMKNVDAAGPVNSEGFRRLVSMKDVKKHNWFVNREAKLYYFYFTKNQVKHLMVVELSDEMVAMVNKAGYLGFGVWQK